MTFSIAQVSLLLVGYLFVLFGLAWSTEKGWIPEFIIKSRLTFVLSLGAIASAWAYYGVVDLAYQYGYAALAYYLGACALFLFSPLIMAPLALLANRFQINNLADLMAFRFHSLIAGKITAAGMLPVLLTVLILQLQAVADTLQIMTAGSLEQLPELFTAFDKREFLAFCYCIILALFTLAFGAVKQHSSGLLVAMAFDGLFKIFALTAVGALAVFGVFGGFNGLEHWLEKHPVYQDMLRNPIRETSAHTLALVFLSSALAMPHIFQISRVRGRVRETLATVSWAFPLLFLILALPVFPILWAGFASDVTLPTQYFTLGVPMQSGSRSLTLLAFVGGLAAASGAMIVFALALSDMLLNHWLLPARRQGTQDIQRQQLWYRIGIITAAFALTFCCYQILNDTLSLIDLALIAFIGALQMMPSILVVSYWPTANCRGFITGLTLGGLVWILGLVLPTLSGLQFIEIGFLGVNLPMGIDYWSEIAFGSLLVNIAALVLVSMASESSVEERYSAELCAEDELSHPLRMILDIHSAEQFTERLSESLGQATARREVSRALAELGLMHSERRPYALRRLRDRLEANLSGLVGTAVANEVLNKQIPYHLPEEAPSLADFGLIENRLTQYRTHLTGLAAELNNIRLYHRNTIEELPLAACTLSQNHEILLWNHAMEKLTGFGAEQVVGACLEGVASPWMQILKDFTASPHQHLHKQQVALQGRSHWINLHKASVHGPADEFADGQIVLLEDVTESQLLEQELVHTERLASVGRLAAGVAHEIGNPITGIACLAQNLRYETDDPLAAEETADQILSQTERVSRIVQSLVSFSHAGHTDKSRFSPCSVWDCVNEAVQLLQLQKEKHPVSFDNGVDPDLTVNSDHQQLIQVFINLLSNARDASEPYESITIRGRATESDAVIEVEDNGCGIPAVSIERVLEPFFTTKEPGEGTGLGLAMVYSIIEEHEGQLDIESPTNERDTGTRIRIKLPLALATDRQSGNT